MELRQRVEEEIDHLNPRLEELAEGDPHARDQAVEPGGDFFQRVFHERKSFSIALDSISVKSETGMRIFQERLSSP